MTGSATGAGMILGTAGYMSPEQAGGKAVDKRADIWSFGVVVWEMLAGRRLFAGETVTETLARDSRAAAALPGPRREDQAARYRRGAHCDPVGARRRDPAR